MDKIKKLILAVIPNNNCNLKCEYCYISQMADWEKKDKEKKYSPQYMAKCLSVERLGGIALINLTGNGETMLDRDIVEIIRCFLEEGHYVEVVTNGTIKKRMEEVAHLPEKLTKRLFFKISFHYKELVRLNMLESFYQTLNLLREKNIAFTLELMAYDGIEEKIDEIKESCIKNIGACCQATIGRSDRKKGRDLLSSHNLEDYGKVWEKIDSPMQRFKLDIIGEKRKEFCYAGSWSLFLNLYTGDTKRCYRQPYDQNIFEDINRPIKFNPVGHYCMQPYCINGHSHLTWGDIPELDAPNYFEMRNRECVDGSNWINNDCKDFFKTKLYETNKEYSGKDKVIHTLLYPIKYPFRMMWNPDLNCSRIKKLLKFWNKEKYHYK